MRQRPFYIYYTTSSGYVKPGLYFLNKDGDIMPLNQVLAWGGSGVLLLLTLVQLAPIKLDPWSAIARWIGKAINGDVLVKLDELNHAQQETQARLDGHIKSDDERDADLHRTRILQFNTELLREAKHTKEDFSEILYNIDCYERYCREHPEYQNNRAVHAIANISRVYNERLQKHDFL